MPRDFRFPNGEIDVFVPTVFTPEVLARRTSYYRYVVARLRAGVSVEAAQTEMNTVARTLESEDPKAGRGVPASVVPLREQLARGVPLFGRDLSLTLGVLLGAVGPVLLMTCACWPSRSRRDS